MTDCGCECELDANNRGERRVLGILLAINAAMFVVEFGIGSRWPDLIIGAAIAVLVLRGGIRIVRDARNEHA